MSDDDKTVRMVTNLDRKAIEGKLAEVRKAAQAANLTELAAMFNRTREPTRVRKEFLRVLISWLAHLARGLTFSCRTTPSEKQVTALVHNQIHQINHEKGTMLHERIDEKESIAEEPRSRPVARP